MLYPHSSHLSPLFFCSANLPSSYFILNFLQKTHHQQSFATLIFGKENFWEMAEAAASIVAEQVAAPAASWIKRQLSYVFNFKRHVQNFYDQLNKLKLQRERIERDVDDATTRRMEVIHRDVEDWLQRLTTVDENAKHLLEETERAKNGCFFGFCPNVKARYQLSKKAERESKAAADLLSQGEFPRLSYRPAPQGILFPTNKDYETFESRACHFEKIMEALKDPNVSMIGVWGMGGVGKTTLVKKAAEQAKVDRVFDVVIFSEISLNPELEKIQEEIADALGLKLNMKSIPGRSNELRECFRSRLEKEKKENKILVILDNIWAVKDKLVSLDLGDLGLPSRDDRKGCKILMTSRDEEVLTRMDTNILIRVDALEEGEAWNLFEKMAGNIVNALHLKPLAIKIAKRCAGLPISITTVAMTLRNKGDSRIWEAALYKLEHDVLEKPVHSALEFSYDHLGSNVIQQLFLLCGQLVNTDYAIEDLLNYCMTLDSFDGINRLEDRRNELHTLVENLKSKCLLLHGEKNGHVKMHDVVRSFAVSYASKKCNMFMAEYDGELKEWPGRNTVARFSSIYFPHNHIDKLLDGLECPKLKLFILHSKNRYLKIPCLFFKGLGGIIVLDIKNIVLPSLPSSFDCLVNLRTLSLEKCELEDTAMIGELVGLEVLRFVNTNISHLPEEIRKLTSLKLLCVSRCIKLKVIPRNVISSLTQLEELSLEGSFVNWEVEGDNCQNACLAELKKLFKLTSLDIHIPNSNIMPNDLFSDKLKSFKILIGDGWDWNWYSKYETSQRLKLKLSTDIHSKSDVKKLLKKTEDLYLDELDGVNSVCKLDGEGRFPRLRCLHVQRGHNFQYIVNSNTRVPCPIFPYLEVLSLEKLTNLEMICRGQLGKELFSKLRIVKVKRCDMLKNLFSFTIDKFQLLQLQEIEVENCENMEEIFSCETEEDRCCDIVIELKQVHSLCLKNLPKITSFCSEVKNAKQKQQIGDSLGSSQNMQLMIKDEPIPLLNGKIVFPKLEKLVLSSIGIEKIWDSCLLTMSHCFETLRDLEVSDCNKLKFLFPIGVVTSLIQLKRLSVVDCELMEDIIEGHMFFPKLDSLHLGDLPKLKRFCTGNSIEFPSLSYMLIRECPELKSFIFDEKKVGNDDLPPPLFDEKVKFPTIESLYIWSVNLKRIWHNELAPDSFCKLDYLYLRNCENLLNVFPSNMLTRLQNLRKLHVQDCKSMDVIFDLEGVVDADDKFEFPKVTSLTLYDMPRLRSFYPGIHTSAWPLLKILSVTRCEKLKIFASEFSNVQEGVHDERPLFLLEKDILPNHLEELRLTWNYTMNEMWHGEFLFEVFCRLKSLIVEGLTSFPPGFFKKLPNLEDLGVLNSDLEEIFPNRGVIGEAGELSTFCTLKTLMVVECHRLKILFPSSLLSFCNLIRLEIEFCDGLTYLMSSSTAKSMMQLQQLNVRRCETMTSIVECVREGEAEDDIIFPQLEKLKILDLPDLSSFCGSGKLAFELPSLETVIVDSCPNLKTFCEGPLSASKLRSVIGMRWNGDLNTTIQTLYKERVTMTIRIQRQFRTHIARRNFIALRKASIVIQSAVRGNNARKIFESLKGDIALN